MDLDFFKESNSSCSSCKAWFCLVRMLLTDCSCCEACSSSSRLSLVMSLSRFLLSSIYGRKKKSKNTYLSFHTLPRVAQFKPKKEFKNKQTHIFFLQSVEEQTFISDYLYLCFSVSGRFNFVFSLVQYLLSNTYLCLGGTALFLKPFV